MLTVAQAAKEVGMSRSGIWKAIKQGRLSATKNDKGDFVIDPVELFRVYTPVDVVNNESKQSSTPVNESNRLDEVDELRIRLELTNKLLAKSESECDDLRRRLDQESAKVTMLLTYQPIKPDEFVNGRKEDSLLWRKLYGRYQS